MVQPLQQLLRHRKVLLLQGPMGRFFKKLADWLDQHGIEYQKINFNGGDALFFGGPQALAYRGTLDEFSGWLAGHMTAQGFEAVLCFGDCRLYHQSAKQVCQQLGRPFFVFEEGYLRPDYITFEQGGVNAFSPLRHQWPQVPVYPASKPRPVHSRFMLMVVSACLYYLAWILLSWRFPHYQHHRQLTPRQELLAWLTSAWRRLVFRRPDQQAMQQILRDWDGQYFIMALQVHNDSQVRVHSDYQDVVEFIQEGMASFARSAPAQARLVIKHHPMDRGYRNYRTLIAREAERLGLQSRVHYVCDVHLPSLIKHSLGLVTINSTTGLQALFHHKPVKVMGSALYDVEGLTSGGSLDQFWVQPRQPDMALYQQFRSQLIWMSQLNGSFYGDSPWMRTALRQEAPVRPLQG